MARGTLTIHSVSRALAPHIEWAASGVLGVPVRVKWQPQPAAKNAVRMSITWTAAQGTGARLATALRGWDGLRFEITEEASEGSSGSRWMYTPELGIHHSSMDHEGNVTLTEDRIRYCLDGADATPATIAAAFAVALGEAWDRELDVYREAHLMEEMPRRLHLVG